MCMRVYAGDTVKTYVNDGVKDVKTDDKVY